MPNRLEQLPLALAGGHGGGAELASGDAGQDVWCCCRKLQLSLKTNSAHGRVESRTLQTPEDIILRAALGYS